MNDVRTLLERGFADATPPPDGFERMLRRRDRKRRNQRIAAGVVGIAVFVAAVWIVTSVGSLDRTQPAVTGPTASPAPDLGPVPESYQPDPSLSRVNVLDLPPEGAPPSSPKHGELVLSVDGRGMAAGRALTHMYLYADGRLIWWREGDLPAGADEHAILEQRLTPEGVELMRSEVISSGLFDRDLVFMGGEADPDPLPFWGNMAVRDGDRMVGLQLGWVYFSTEELCEPDAESCEGDTIMTAEQERALELLDARLADPASWLPASAWADQGIKIYVPTTYRVCYGGTTETIERDRLLHAIQGPVQELLEARDAENERFNMYISFGEWVDGVRVTGYCSELTTEEARDVVRGLDDAGFEREQLPTYANGPSGWEYAHATFEYIFSVPEPAGTAALWIDPYLPHGPSCVTCA
jgi:hypothetical protein